MGPAPVILVVDDEPFIRRALTFVLAREGYLIEVASDGDEALELMKRLRPRLVFLDIMMPRRSGFEVCEEARKDPHLKDAHIVLLTARGQAADRERGLEAGADAYMVKPFSPAAILDRVRQVIGPPPAPLTTEAEPG